MIELAIITKISDNKITFRLPILEQAGRDNFITEGNVCYQPGNYNGYQVGDTIYVDFVNNEYGHPVVVGKMLKGNEMQNTSFSPSAIAYLNSLRVMGKAKFSNEFEVGELTYDDIYNCYLENISLKEKVDSLCLQVEALTKEVNKLKS